jgi:hypothetical protein
MASIKKSGSKNNVANRGTGAKIKTYNGKNVAPVKFIASGKSFMAAQYEDKSMVLGPNGEVLPYASIQ